MPYSVKVRESKLPQAGNFEAEVQPGSKKPEHVRPDDFHGSQFRRHSRLSTVPQVARDALPFLRLGSLSWNPVGTDSLDEKPQRRTACGLPRVTLSLPPSRPKERRKSIRVAVARLLLAGTVIKPFEGTQIGISPTAPPEPEIFAEL